MGWKRGRGFGEGEPLCREEGCLDAWLFLFPKGGA